MENRPDEHPTLTNDEIDFYSQLEEEYYATNNN
jgi:hypothetical protein